MLVQVVLAVAQVVHVMPTTQQHTPSRPLIPWLKKKKRNRKRKRRTAPLFTFARREGYRKSLLSEGLAVFPPALPRPSPLCQRGQGQTLCHRLGLWRPSSQLKGLRRSPSMCRDPPSKQWSELLLTLCHVKGMMTQLNHCLLFVGHRRRSPKSCQVTQD